jgi:hypothetical protein
VIRWYLSKGIGSGSFLDPYRSPIHDLPLGGGIIGYDIPQRRYFLNRVGASGTDHSYIVSQGYGIPLSPIYDGVDGERNGLALPFALHDSGFRTALQAEAEGNGLSATWVTGSHRMGDVIAYFIKIMRLAQTAYKKHEGFDYLFTLRLSDPVTALSPARRNAVRDWMMAKGIDTSWITPTTTIREVLHAVITGLVFDRSKVGEIEF